MSTSRLAWYLRRAAAMSPPELIHRVREQWRRSRSRHDRRGWSRFDIGDGPLRPLSALAAFSDATWPPGIEDMARGLQATGPLSFLGQSWPDGDNDRPGRWHRDPASGRCWPAAETYCFDVRWRDVTDKADVKFVLELNRFQHLHAAAAIAIRDRDPALALSAAGELIAWMDDNPPFRGINWLSGIELALRLVSAAFVATALDAACPGHAHRPRLRAFVAAHAWWLDRFPSLHSSANNHLVAEGLGLVVAAEIVPDMPRAARYRRHGRAILSAAAFSQFHEDGTGVEQSPTYAAFTLEMLLLGILIERSRGHEPSPETAAAIARAAAHLRALLDSGGNCPRIGDDDEGRVVATPPAHEDRYVASIVAAAAGVLRRPDLAPPARPAQLRDVLFDPPPEPAPPPRGVLSFRAGGYTVVRERLSDRDMLLVMDHGPVGFDPLAAHGHADALSLWLHLDGQPVFVDAGTYRYNASAGWRERLRATPAHNTLTVNGRSQSLTAGDFNWRRKAASELLGLDASDRWRVSARHDGYLGRFGVAHERTCRRVDGGILVEDMLTPPRDGLSVAIGFLFHPALTVTVRGDGVVVSRDGSGLLRLSSDSCAATIAAAAGGPDEGAAYSPQYNSLQRATRIEFRPLRFDEPHRTLVEILASPAAAVAAAPAFADAF